MCSITHDTMFRLPCWLCSPSLRSAYPWGVLCFFSISYLSLSISCSNIIVLPLSQNVSPICINICTLPVRGWWVFSDPSWMHCMGHCSVSSYSCSLLLWTLHDPEQLVGQEEERFGKERPCGCLFSYFYSHRQNIYYMEKISHDLTDTCLLGC